VPVTAKLSKLFYDRLVSRSRTNSWTGSIRWTQPTEQRLAELDAKWGRQWDRLDGKLEQRLAELDTKLDGKVDRVAAELNATLERRLGEQTRWLFVAWASLLIPIIGLWIRG
jgi:hypothetical protein